MPAEMDNVKSFRQNLQPPKNKTNNKQNKQASIINHRTFIRKYEFVSGRMYSGVFIAYILNILQINFPRITDSELLIKSKLHSFSMLQIMFWFLREIFCHTIITKMHIFFLSKEKRSYYKSQKKENVRTFGPATSL